MRPGRRTLLHVQLSVGLGGTAGRTIGRMIDPIVYGDLSQQEGVDALEAADVVAILSGERTSLVVRVDAALAAEVVLGHPSVELIQTQMVLAMNDADACQWNRCNDRSLAPPD